MALPARPLSLRLRLHEQARLGPGKVALLEAVQQAGSVASAGATMDMSARRAWLLIDSLNRAFDSPVVDLTDPGSPAASEAQLSELGKELVRAYRAVESDAANAAERRFAPLLARLKISSDG